MRYEPDPGSETFLLGACLYEAQRVEFVLYAIAAHLAHLPEMQRDRRLRALGPENFLRGDPRKFTVTFGQLVAALGDRLLLGGDEIERYVVDRNLLVHGYYRQFHSAFSHAPGEVDPLVFLRDFFERSQMWIDILRGLLNELMRATAAREARSSELVFSDADLARTELYLQHAQRHLEHRGL